MAATPGSPERIQVGPQENVVQPQRESRGSGNDPIQEGKAIVQKKIDDKTRQYGNFDGPVQAELRGQYTPEIKSKITDNKANASEVRQRNDLTEKIDSDVKISAQNVTRVVSEFAEAAKQGIIIPPAHPPTEAVFKALVQKLPGNISERTASYILPLVEGLLNKDEYVTFSQPGEEPTDLEKDLVNMMSGKEHDENAWFVQDVFLDAIAKGSIPDIDADIFRGKITAANESKRAWIAENKNRRERGERGGGYAETAYLELFNDPRDKESLRAMRLYEALKTTNIDDFMKYYGELVAQAATEIREEQKKEPTEEEAQKKATLDLHKTLLHIVNTIYATTLKKAPEADFDATAREEGSAFANPNNIFNEIVAGKLSRLVANAQNYKGTTDAKFYTYERKTTQYYNETTKRIEDATVPTANLEQVELAKFAESLREITEIERGALRYQFNFGFLINHPPAQDKGGIFGTIANFAKQNLKTETIDNLYILPYNEVIQAAIMSLEPMYERLFAKYDWKKSTKMQTELFEQLQPAEKKALDQLLSYFKDYTDPQGNKVPAWAITRAFYHARLMSFGKEFKFQLLTSYADPLLKDTGKQTYLGEGALDKNSVFDIMSAAKRWGDGTDPYIVGLTTMPWNKMIDDKDFHPTKLQKQGEKMWEDSFTYGDMSYFESPIFRDKDGKPIISLTNFTKMGGVDAYGGWRVRYAYMHWIQDIVDLRSHDIDVDHKLVTESGQQIDDKELFVKGWKSVENIGTNVLRNYMESFLLDKYNEKTDEKYATFFKFLYKRYFKEGVGKAMYDNVQNENDYWTSLKNKLVVKTSGKDEVTDAMKKAILQEEIYNALTVVLYERMPTEFLFMERRRSSQNGVTLQQELLEEFVGTSKKKGAWAQNATTQADFDKVINEKWETALDDLIFVQQAARMDTIFDMKKRVDTAEDPNKLGVLYGDLSKDRSEVNYVIDEARIEQALRKKYSPELEGQSATDQSKAAAEAQIKRVKDLYRKMTLKIQQKPEEGILEKKWKGSDKKKDRDLYKEAKAATKKRVKWFSDTWQDYGFGMQFTADSAGQFLNRSATGEETIARTAEACQVISETTKNYVAGGGLLDGINDAVRQGREGWETLRKGISDVYSTAKEEDGDVAKNITTRLVNWASMGLRRDSDTMGLTGKLGHLRHQIERKQTSLAAKKVGEGTAYDWDKQDIYEFVSMFTDKNIISRYTKDGDRRYKDVPLKGMEKIWAQIRGKPLTKQERDYSNEVSGEVARALNKSSNLEVFMAHGAPALGLILIALLAVIAKKAAEDEEM